MPGRSRLRAVFAPRLIREPSGLFERRWRKTQPELLQVIADMQRIGRIQIGTVATKVIQSL